MTGDRRKGTAVPIAIGTEDAEKSKMVEINKKKTRDGCRVTDELKIRTIYDGETN